MAFSDPDPEIVSLDEPLKGEVASRSNESIAESRPKNDDIERI